MIQSLIFETLSMVVLFGLHLREIVLVLVNEVSQSFT